MQRLLAKMFLMALTLVSVASTSFAESYTLTIASSNPSSGVAITVSPNDTSGRGNGSTQFTRSYNSGTVVTLTAPATSSGGTFQKWQKGTADYATTAKATVTVTSSTTMTAVFVAAPPVSTHSGITGTFTTPAQVTAKCLECHASVGASVASSLHGMMATNSPNVTNATGLSQKLGEINSFCSYPNPALAGSACLTCHPTLGKYTNLTAADLDCLMCHNDAYKRRFTNETDPAKFRTVVNWQGVTQTYVPAKMDANGNFTAEFNWTLMPGLTALDLIKNVKKPTTVTCLNCHGKAAGSDWAKRGDLGLNSATATAAQDVHLASVANAGAGLTCSSCHVPSNHKIPGRGIDLRPTETGVTVKKCVDCHIGMDSGSGHTQLGIRVEPDRHVKRVACQACHIPTFGRGGATEMSRNWTVPTWNAALCNGQGAWAGEEVKASNVVPELTFFNGTSYVYKFGQTLDRIDPITGLTMLADANGGINDAVGVSKLVPIKRHQSTMAVMSSGTDINKLIPYDVVWQFMTGLFDQAAEKGKTFAGYAGTHQWKTVEAEMAINHGVAPRAGTAPCANCHGTAILNSSTLSKLDKIGYAAIKPMSDLCNDCHSLKTNTDFFSLHDKHRSKANCNKCHSFTR